MDIMICHYCRHPFWTSPHGKKPTDEIICGKCEVKRLPVGQARSAFLTFQLGERRW